MAYTKQAPLFSGSRSGFANAEAYWDAALREDGHVRGQSLPFSRHGDPWRGRLSTSEVAASLRITPHAHLSFQASMTAPFLNPCRPRGADTLLGPSSGTSRCLLWLS